MNLWGALGRAGEGERASGGRKDHASACSLHPRPAAERGPGFGRVAITVANGRSGTCPGRCQHRVQLRVQTPQDSVSQAGGGPLSTWGRGPGARWGRGRRREPEDPAGLSRSVPGRKASLALVSSSAVSGWSGNDGGGESCGGSCLLPPGPLGLREQPATVVRVGWSELRGPPSDHLGQTDRNSQGKRD